jgi:hypothetical protein
LRERPPWTYWVIPGELLAGPYPGLGGPLHALVDTGAHAGEKLPLLKIYQNLSSR